MTPNKQQSLREQQIRAWAKAPSYAKSIAQDWCGIWFPHTVENPRHMCCTWSSKQKCIGVYRGQINGWDWKDTLQTREEHEAMLLAEKQEPLGAEFEKVLYDNIEDLYEMDKEQWKPEGNTKCEVMGLENTAWHEIEVLYVGQTYLLGRKTNGHEMPYKLSSFKFRPIQTTEDKEREEAYRLLHIDPEIEPRFCGIVDSLIDLGYRKLEEGQKIVSPLTDDDSREIIRQIKRQLKDKPVMAWPDVIELIQRKIGAIS